MKTLLLLGGFNPGQSLWSIKQGFESLGCEVLYLPTRGCIEAHRDRDVALAQEEADIIPAPEDWVFKYKDDAGFQDGLCEIIEKHKPGMLWWWFSKDDRPAGLINHLRAQYPWCKTVTHTQDDPWDVLRNPQFSSEFEYAVTCCKESIAEYAKKDIKAIVLYPPPVASLHKVASPAPFEACDFSITIMSIYSRAGGNEADYLKSADPVTRITHTIPFPQQRVLRQEVVAALKDLGNINIYGGLGYGTFDHIPRSSYRGFRNYHELPGVYAAAKININHHNSPMSYGYLNQRDTAITGSGGFMLTDYVEGIEEIFEIGAEIDTWETLEELQDKAKWWLAHDQEREQAARRAQEHIHQDYGNVAYAERLIEFVEGQ
jgi:hypothetical protein